MYYVRPLPGAGGFAVCVRATGRHYGTYFTEAEANTVCDKLNAEHDKFKKALGQSDNEWGFDR